MVPNKPTLTLTVCLLCGVMTAAAQSKDSQAKPEEVQAERVITDPDEMVSVLSAWAEAGFLFQFAREGKLDDSLVNLRMKNRSRWSKESAGGEWAVETPEGFVSLRVWSPAFLRKDTNEMLIVFTPREEHPIPEALLSHLLTKASSTKIDGASMLEIEMPSEQVPLSSCRSRRTLKLRLASGAMVLNGVRITCDEAK